MSQAYPDLDAANPITAQIAAQRGAGLETRFDPTPLPSKPVEWRRALRALVSLSGGDYDGQLIMTFSAALEGDEGEDSFQEFLRQAGSLGLLERKPLLEANLDDFDALGRLPDGSLGQHYRRLAIRDEISVASLVEGERGLPDEAERAPDAVRSWYRARQLATHDLLHVLTGYDRDTRGEIRLIAFSLAAFPKRVFRIALFAGMLQVPVWEWPRFARELRRAYRRGRAARIPRTTDWEALLALPIEEARAKLGLDRIPGGVDAPLGR